MGRSEARVGHYLRSELDLRAERLGLRYAETLQADVSLQRAAQTPIVDPPDGPRQSRDPHGDADLHADEPRRTRKSSTGPATGARELRPQQQRFATVARRARRRDPAREDPGRPDQDAPRRRSSQCLSRWSRSRPAMSKASAARPIPASGVFLVYGPDAGLVTSAPARCRARGRRSRRPVPADPPRRRRRRRRPGRLADEAGTIGLFGGKRAIWVRPPPATSRRRSTPCSRRRSRTRSSSIEAGDLASRRRCAPLCENRQRALALPCYADAGRDLGELVDEALKCRRLHRYRRDARAAILASLGGDRLATRGELRSYALCPRPARDHARRRRRDHERRVEPCDGRRGRRGVRRRWAASSRSGPAASPPRECTPSVVLGAALRHAHAAARPACGRRRPPASQRCRSHARPTFPPQDRWSSASCSALDTPVP